MKKPLILRHLTLKDEQAFLKAHGLWKTDPNFNFFYGYKPEMKFQEYLHMLNNEEQGINLPEGFVPASFLAGFVGDEIVGRLSFRHVLNDFLTKVGGHIGYGVLENHRRLGYATEMLRLSLPMAKARGLTKVLVTCDEQNLPSAKTIENCSGILENILNGKKRYWIEL